MCRSAGYTWKFPMRNWPGERGHGKHRNLLPAAGTDFFTTTFCRQIRVWISISWLAKVGRRFHGITISPEISRAKALARFPGSGAAQEAAREKIGLNWKETGCRPLSRVWARCRLGLAQRYAEARKGYILATNT